MNFAKHLKNIKGQIVAASRLGPKMYAYRARRVIRSVVSSRWPDIYANYASSLVPDLPSIAGHERQRGLLDAIQPYFNRGSPEEIDRVRRGVLTHFGITKDFGGPDRIRWNEDLDLEGDHQLWRLTNSYMSDVHMLIIAADRDVQRLAIEVIDGFLAVCPIKGADSFKYSWHPYAASQRIMTLASAVAIAQINGTLDPDVWRVVDAFLKLNMSFLLKNIEHELGNNHVERNLAAICLYFALSSPPTGHLKSSVDRDVHDIIAKTVLADGMMIERSAMYQGMTVLSLRIFCRSSFLSPRTLELVNRLLPSAEDAWALLSHPDKDIALFNDSWQDETPLPGDILTMPQFGAVTRLPESGFARLQSQHICALFDAGPIGPDWNPGHGHTDFMAMEVDVAGQRFLVDQGTSQYSSGRQRIFERSAASHNGPRFVDFEPVEYIGCFRVGKIAESRFVDAVLLEGMPFHCVAGQADSAAGHLVRALALLPDGGLLVVDLWSKGMFAGATRLLIDGAWSVEAVDEQAVRFVKDGATAAVEMLVGTAGAIVSTTWSRQYLRSEAGHAFELAPVQKADHAWATFTIGRKHTEAAEAKAMADALAGRLLRLVGADPHPVAGRE